MPRLFYALWPDSTVRADLARAAAALDVRDARAVRPETLHLTLVFVGTVDDAACAALLGSGAAVGGSAFELELCATGWWRASHVAWLAPLATPAALSALVADLRAYLAGHGLAVDAAPFRPHVTVARQVRRAPRATGSIAVHWPVADFALVVSQTDPAGARYSVLARWPLAG